MPELDDILEYHAQFLPKGQGVVLRAALLKWRDRAVVAELTTVAEYEGTAGDIILQVAARIRELEGAE